MMAGTDRTETPIFSSDDAVEPVLVGRRKREESEMDITSMIDMTFLLLIFFVTTSKMGPKSGVDLPTAKHGGAVVEKSSVILTVGPGEPFARVYKGDSVDADDAFAGASMEVQEEEILGYVEREMASGLKKHILVQAAAGLKHREVARIARTVGRAEVRDLHVGVVDKK